MKKPPVEIMLLGRIGASLYLWEKHMVAFPENILKALERDADIGGPRVCFGDDGTPIYSSYDLDAWVKKMKHQPLPEGGTQGGYTVLKTAPRR